VQSATSTDTWILLIRVQRRLKGESCVLIDVGIQNQVWLYICFPTHFSRVTDVPRFFLELVGFFSVFLPNFSTILGVALVHDTRS